MARKEEIPTEHQALALRLASGSGAIRYVVGGWWVAGDHPEVPRNEAPSGEWVTRHSIKACVAREWMVWDGSLRSLITAAGREVLTRYEAEHGPPAMPSP